MKCLNRDSTCLNEFKNNFTFVGVIGPTKKWHHRPK